MKVIPILIIITFLFYLFILAAYITDKIVKAINSLRNEALKTNLWLKEINEKLDEKAR